jgi:hypothetical protein
MDKMKKILILAAFVSVIVALSSCKMHEKCPAYGKVTKANKEVRI